MPEQKLNILKEYQKFCEGRMVPFSLHSTVKSYDASTLFCPAGMQQYKNSYKNKSLSEITVANCQTVLRTDDWDLLGDGTHLAVFNMLGLFSFREWGIKKAIAFWVEFIQSVLQLKIERVTVHPDRKEWAQHYPSEIKVEFDKECKWSDGEIGGYCTEFYVDGVEIGNIVNPLGDCIDAGFGLERLDSIINKTPPKSRLELLEDIARAIMRAGYKPTNVKQGYLLRKTLRALWKEGYSGNLPHFAEEVARQEKLLKLYNSLKDRFTDKPKEWWFSTHGIELDP